MFLTFPKENYTSVNTKLVSPFALFDVFIFKNNFLKISDLIRIVLIIQFKFFVNDVGLHWHYYKIIFIPVAALGPCKREKK